MLFITSILHDRNLVLFFPKKRPGTGSHSEIMTLVCFVLDFLCVHVKTVNLRRRTMTMSRGTLEFVDESTDGACTVLGPCTKRHRKLVTGVLFSTDIDLRYSG